MRKLLMLALPVAAAIAAIDSRSFLPFDHPAIQYENAPAPGFRARPKVIRPERFRYSPKTFGEVATGRLPTLILNVTQPKRIYLGARPSLGRDTARDWTDVPKGVLCATLHKGFPLVFALGLLASR
jgi:hypothetical protein